MKQADYTDVQELFLERLERLADMRRVDLPNVTPETAYLIHVAIRSTRNDCRDLGVGREADTILHLRSA